MSDLQHRLTSVPQFTRIQVRLAQINRRLLAGEAKRTREFIAILTVWLLLIGVGAFVAEQQLRTEAKDMQEVFHAERL